MWIAKVGAALLSSALLLGCSTEVEEVDGAESEITLAGRWRSPLDEGVYDADGGGLLLYGDLDAQSASVRVSARDNVGTCGGRLDIEGETVTLEAEGCSLRLTENGKGGIDVRGKMAHVGEVDLRFVRRPQGALVGTYEGKTPEASPRPVEIVIASSSEKRVVLSLRVDGETVAPRVEARSGSGLALDNYIVEAGPPCPFELDFTRGADGRYWLGVRAGEYEPGFRGSIGHRDLTTCGRFAFLDGLILE